MTKASPIQASGDHLSALAKSFASRLSAFVSYSPSADSEENRRREAQQLDEAVGSFVSCHCSFGFTHGSLALPSRLVQEALTPAEHQMDDRQSIGHPADGTRDSLPSRLTITLERVSHAPGAWLSGLDRSHVIDGQSEGNLQAKFQSEEPVIVGRSSDSTLCMAAWLRGTGCTS